MFWFACYNQPRAQIISPLRIIQLHAGVLGGHSNTLLPGDVNINA